jgi:NAD(P)-dependent dehydrogenase (short-subunit alcohol dehydrogenase family)
MGRLVGKVVAVTGATKGIGRGVALHLAREGALLSFGGRSEAEGRSLVREIERECQLPALFVQGDVGEEVYCERFIQQTVDQFGRLDGLVNNAGIFPDVAFQDSDAELFDRVYRVNVRGAFLTSKFAARQMERQGGGSIVMIGSTHAFGASPHYSVYGTSKGAMYSLTQYLAKNLARQKIRANWITVGWVKTDGEIERIQADGHDEAWLNQIAGHMCPLGGLQGAEDIAYAAVYLLSDESRFVTETDIKVTGGFVPGHD